MEGGRPLKFNNPEELQLKIDQYFEHCRENERPFTVSGLAFFLGTNRQTLLNYEADERFFDTITLAKSRIEGYAEESLFLLRNPNGAIFNLKNNYKWRDQLDVEANTKNTHEHKIRKLSPEEIEAAKKAFDDEF